MNTRALAALASSSAGAVGAILLLSGRLGGTVATALILGLGARAGAAALLGPESSSSELRAIARSLPAWVLVCAAASVRAGSAVLADVRGAHAVAGIALVRGSAVSVAGAWTCLLALAVSIGAAMAPRPHAAPLPAARASRLATAILALLAAALFAGPEVRGAGDVVVWVSAAIGTLASAVILRGRTAGGGLASSGLAAVGLALILVGGRP